MGAATTYMYYHGIFIVASTLGFQKNNINTHVLYRAYMDVSKNRGKTSKMDGLFHGSKTLLNLMIWGVVFHPYFLGLTPPFFGISHVPGGRPWAVGVASNYTLQVGAQPSNLWESLGNQIKFFNLMFEGSLKG